MATVLLLLLLLLVVGQKNNLVVQQMESRAAARPRVRSSLALTAQNSPQGSYATRKRVGSRK
jgi:hypothetical protein